MRRLSLALLIGLGLSSVPYQVGAQVPEQKLIQHPSPATCDQDWDTIEQRLEDAVSTTDKLKVSGGYKLLGYNLEQCNRLDAALSAYRRSQDLYPRIPNTHQIANILVKQQKITQALDLYRQRWLVQREDMRGVGSTKSQSTSEIEALVYADLAQALVQQGKLERAISMYRYAIQLAPKNDLLWYNLGHIYTQQHRFKRAFIALRQAEKLKASTFTDQQLDARAHLQVADWTQNKPAQRLAFLKQSIELDPTFERAYTALGKHYFQTEQWDLALTTYRQILKLFPNRAYGHQQIGVLLARQDDYDGAFEHFHTTLKLTKRETRQGRVLEGAAYKLLANVLQQQHKPTAAVEAYKQAITLNPDDIRTIYQLGSFLTELERWDEAITHLRRAQELVNRPNQSIPLLAGLVNSTPELITAHLADALAHSGRPDEAIKILRQAQAQSPKGPLISYTLSKVLSQVGQHQEARTAIRQTFPKGIQSSYTDTATSTEAHLIAKHGEIYFSLKDYGKALAHYDEAIQLDPKFPLLHYHRGDALRQMGQWEQAIQAYQTSIRLQPRILEFTHKNFSGLGWSLLEKNQIEPAISAFQKAIKHYPHSVEAHYGLGKALLIQQKNSDAVHHLQTAFKLNPRHPGLSEDLQRAKKLTETNS